MFIGKAFKRITEDPPDFVQWTMADEYGVGAAPAGVVFSAHGRTFKGRVSERDTTFPDGPITDIGLECTFTPPDTINCTGHGLAVGYNFNLTKAGASHPSGAATLPTGLSEGADGDANAAGGVAAGQYWIINDSFGTNSFKFSTTLGGSIKTFTGSGSGSGIFWVSDPTNRFAVRVGEAGAVDGVTFEGGRVTNHVTLTGDGSLWSSQPPGYDYNNSACVLHDTGTSTTQTEKWVKNVRMGGSEAGHGIWDGVSFGQSGTIVPGQTRCYVEGCWMSDLRDDAIEADSMGSVTIRDSLIERTVVGASNSVAAAVDLHLTDTIDWEDCLVSLAGFPYRFGSPQSVTFNTTSNVVTWGAHDRLPGAEIVFDRAHDPDDLDAAPPSPLVFGVTYYIREVKSASTFTLAATWPGGAEIDLTGTAVPIVTATSPTEAIDYYGKLMKLTHPSGYSPNWTATNSIFALLGWNYKSGLNAAGGWDTCWSHCNGTTGSSFLYLGYDVVTFGTNLVNFTRHARAAGCRLKFKAGSTLPSPLVAETTYYVAASPAPTTDTFAIASSLGGAALTFTGPGSGTHECSAMPDIGTIAPSLTQDVGASANAAWLAARAAWLAAHRWSVDRLDTDTE